MNDSVNEEMLVEGFVHILRGLGLDLENDPHLQETPVRAARAWFHELNAGLTSSPPTPTLFPAQGDEMVVLRGIPIRSLCSHHMLPFYGHADIGYIPGGAKMLGLSKLSRVADYWARRPQVQETLTAQIADNLATLLEVKEEEKDIMGRIFSGRGGVGVVIRATHLCMLLRGVQHEGEMVTSAMRGVFLSNQAARAEFLQLTQKG